MSELPKEAVEAAAKALRGYTGDCICHEAYTGRGLRDPNCQHCDLLGVHEDILAAAAAFIAAQTLRDAADGWQAYIRAMNWGTTAPIDWLRARADRIEGK